MGVRAERDGTVTSQHDEGYLYFVAFQSAAPCDVVRPHQVRPPELPLVLLAPGMALFSSRFPPARHPAVLAVDPLPASIAASTEGPETSRCGFLRLKPSKEDCFAPSALLVRQPFLRCGTASASSSG